MNIWTLVVLTIAALAVAAIASFKLVNAKLANKRALAANAYQMLAAEDLLSTILCVPLSYVLTHDDEIEILIRVNGYPVAASSYLADQSGGHLKLIAKRGV